MANWTVGQLLGLSTCSLLLLLHMAAGQTTDVCAYYENQTIYSYQPYTQLQVVVKLNSAAVSGSGATTSVSNTDITYISFQRTLISLSSPIIVVERTVEMLDSTSKPPLIQLTTSLTHLSNSTAANLNTVTVSEDISNGLQAFWTSSFIPGLSTSGVSVTGRTSVAYVPTSALNPGDNATIQYEAEPSGGDGEDLAEGVTFFTSYLSFNDTPNSFGPLELPICLRNTRTYANSIFYEHGFTALTFFVAMLMGFLLVVIGVWLYLFICRRRKKSSVYPSHYDENRMKASGKKIVMDPKAALSRGTNAIKDYSIMNWNESIVMILSMKDKLHMFREIDNLDVLATIHVDTDLEQEQNDAASQTSVLLIQGLQHNGDISKATGDGVVNSFNTQLKDMDKKLDNEYKKELEVVYTDLSAKNKEKMAELLQRHRQQKQQAITATKGLPDKERTGLLNLIDQQHQMEQNELTFTLALEQNEGTERLRKEFAIRKRMGIKELQQGMMSDTISNGQLNAQQAEWLMKEHKKQQEAVHRMYDEETSRQRMVLEEKLAKRRALAQASETQEDDNKELLNLWATHIHSYIEKGKKNGTLTGDQSEDWIDQLKAKVLAMKTEMDETTESEEKDLHKKLSQAKVSRLNELIKKHKAEILEFNKKSKSMQTDTAVDPVSYAEGMLQLKSQHRAEIANLENQIDAEHAQQLADLRQRQAESAEERLKEVERETVQKAQEEGMTEKVIAKLVQKHEDETETLHNTQEKNRRNQEEKLKEELSRRQREWKQRREQERQEQEDLREHEAEVVEKLVNSQVTMSEAERDRILKEHEKQMVLLENSLTLNKLRQQRALEERLNQKRAQQMNKLQDQQDTEATKQRKVAENNGEEDSEDTHQAALDLMKKHAQQRIAVMQGDQLDIDSELEEIRLEMTKERALVLKGQEERLGAMITALQMEKAREMTQIEEKQKAINSLKANLIDDLSDRGILSTPECERILDVHRQESQALNQRLDSQRSKQEQLLRAKLEARMKQREGLIVARQESEMKTLIEGNKFGAKVRRAMLVHKHMVEMEKFRNRMEREVAQALAETRRQFEVLKLQKLQEQELAFVAGLVRVGCFQENELLDVLYMLFPGKTEEEVKQVLAAIMEGSEAATQSNMPKSQQDSMIVERTYQAQYASPTLLNRTGSVKAHSSRKSRLGKRGSRSALTYPASSNTVGVYGDIQADLRRGSAAELPMYDRRGSGVHTFSHTNPAYPHSNSSWNKRPSLSTDHPNQYPDRSYGLDSIRRIDDGPYRRDYEPDVDYVAMGASMTDGDGGPMAAGRLPPLQDQDSPRRRKKKKKSMLKRHRQHAKDENL